MTSIGKIFVGSACKRVGWIMTKTRIFILLMIMVTCITFYTFYKDADTGIQKSLEKQSLIKQSSIRQPSVRQPSSIDSDQNVVKIRKSLENDNEIQEISKSETESQIQESLPTNFSTTLTLSEPLQNFNETFEKRKGKQAATMGKEENKIRSMTYWTRFNKVLSMSKTLYQFKQLASASKTDGTTIEELQRLEMELFPWLREPLIKLKDRWTIQRGIVLTTGQFYLPLAIHLIQCIRTFDTELPIEVFYSAGYDKFTSEHLLLLAKLVNVRAIDIQSVFNDDMLQLQGWDMKPFALLASSFKEAILMDADAVLMVSPATLFSYSEYRSSGALFFKDRIRNGKPCYKDWWFAKILPQPFSKKLLESNMYKGTSRFEQESGLIVMDKEMHFYGLLASCNLNIPSARKLIRAESLGEKETFWLGLEVAQEAYEFLSDHAGIISTFYDKNRNNPSNYKTITKFRGHLAHFDKSGSLVWFNDGLVRHKAGLKRAWNSVQYKTISNQGHWNESCLWTSEIRDIPNGQKELLNLWSLIWNDDPLIKIARKLTSMTKKLTLQ